MSNAQLEDKLIAGRDIHKPRTEELDRRMAEEAEAKEWGARLSQERNRREQGNGTSGG